VRSGLGVAIVPRWSASRELAAGALIAVSVASPRMSRSWGICHFDGQNQLSTVRTFLEVCRETLGQRLARGS